MREVGKTENRSCIAYARQTDPALRARWLNRARARFSGPSRHVGAARSAVLELLAAEGQCLLDAQQIIERLRPRRACSPASVYRILQELLDLGLIDRLDGRDGVARYEINDPRHRHHHFIDDRTGVRSILSATNSLIKRSTTPPNASASDSPATKSSSTAPNSRHHQTVPIAATNQGRWRRLVRTRYRVRSRGAERLPNDPDLALLTLPRRQHTLLGLGSKGGRDLSHAEVGQVGSTSGLSPDPGLSLPLLLSSAAGEGGTGA